MTTMLQDARKVVNKTIEMTDDWERNPWSKFSQSPQKEFGTFSSSHLMPQMDIFQFSFYSHNTLSVQSSAYLRQKQKRLN